MMSGTSEPGASGYTLDELAGLLGVTPGEATAILEEHGYAAPAGTERLTLSEEDYKDLMTAPPLADDDPTG
jgi:hypothetical protein